MSNGGVEQPLNILLPTYNNEFPSELVNLATALLAQSRSHNASLKTEEQIARPYACAEIACKRLKSKLRLPSLQSRPPCPPKVYKKLCTYLEQVLPSKLPTKRPVAAIEEDDSHTNTTPIKGTTKKARLATNPPTISTPSKSKNAAATPVTTPRKVLFTGTIAERGSNANNALNNGDAPPHIMPLIRRLCKTFSTPQPAPHVYTGASIILPLTDLTPLESSNTFAKDSTALTIALFFLVLARMQRGKLPAETYLARTNAAIEVSGQNVKQGQTSLSSEDIDSWVRQIILKGWAMGMEWWDNIPENIIGEDEVQLNPDDADMTSTVGDLADDDDDDILQVTHRAKMTRRRPMNSSHNIDPDLEQDTGEDDLPDPPGVVLPGLATMVQDRVDWLSDERRDSFLEWKMDFMQRIEVVEREQKSSSRR